MKNKEVISRVTSLFDKGITKIKTNLTPRYIYFKLLSSRAKILNQMLNKKQTVSGAQSFSLEVVKNEKPSVLKCDSYISKKPMPQPIVSLFGNGIISITDSNDPYQKYTLKTADEINKSSFNRYAKNSNGYCIIDNKLLLSGNRKVNKVLVIGIFENPEVIFDLNNDDCADFLEDDFPMPMDKIDLLVEMTVNELAIAYNQVEQNRKTQQPENDEKEN